MMLLMMMMRVIYDVWKICSVILRTLAERAPLSNLMSIDMIANDNILHEAI